MHRAPPEHSPRPSHEDIARTVAHCRHAILRATDGQIAQAVARMQDYGKALTEMSLARLGVLLTAVKERESGRTRLNRWHRIIYLSSDADVVLKLTQLPPRQSTSTAIFPPAAPDPSGP